MNNGKEEPAGIINKQCDKGTKYDDLSKVCETI